MNPFHFWLKLDLNSVSLTYRVFDLHREKAMAMKMAKKAAKAAAPAPMKAMKAMKA